MATLFGTVQGTAQITIAPTTLYLDDQNRFGTMLVLNGSSQPQEVSIEFEFGYLAADSAGNPEMVYDDSLAASEKSVADRILGFPSNFTLQPNQRQVVRLTVRNTGSLADGTYWSRIRTISNPVSPSIEEQTSEGISAQINFRFEQVTTAFFKKGNVTTGLDFGESNVSITDDTGIIHTRMSQTGNSPYIGTMNLRILNEQGDLVTESSSTVAIYFTTQRQFQFDASEMPPGTYTAEMVFETTRTSIDDAEMVQASPINHTVTFRMQ
ncbi:MAG: hypothetical protein U5K31_03965 [Balneolaceae bacterium]|nr:hypothetical protein [Balneolaceae bacterium]